MLDVSEVDAANSEIRIAQTQATSASHHSVISHRVVCRSHFRAPTSTLACRRAGFVSALLRLVSARPLSLDKETSPALRRNVMSILTVMTTMVALLTSASVLLDKRLAVGLRRVAMTTTNAPLILALLLPAPAITLLSPLKIAMMILIAPRTLAIRRLVVRIL